MHLTKVQIGLIGFQIFCHNGQIKRDLENYESFYSDVEVLFEKKDKELQQTIDENLKSIPEESHYEYIEACGEDLHENQFLFPSMHRESIFITLYNYLEHNLNEYCKTVSTISENPIKLKDLNHKGVQRAIIYLKKVLQLNLGEAESQYQFIVNSNNLRNCIVHAGGVLPNDKDAKLNKFVRSHEYLSGSPGQSVLLRKEFIPVFIENLSIYLKTVGAETSNYVQTKYNT